MADNPQAFPTTDRERVDDITLDRSQPGMTLRDYFAGQAIPGFAVEYQPEAAAGWAYKVADAMLAAREAKP